MKIAVNNIYRPPGSCGKVMFLHVSVILFTSGEGGLCQGDPLLPRQRPPPGQRPLWTDPLDRGPLDRNPPDRDCPQIETAPRQWTETPGQRPSPV